MMNWSDVVGLVNNEPSIDSEGFPVSGSSKPRNVFANRKSVKSSEYYAAKQSGIQLSLIFEIRDVDYQGETKIKYKGNSYEIERSYEKGEFIELTCKKEGDTHEVGL